jgi:hypothetical protein
MTTLERASRYVAALPAAISGSRGHDALFRVACLLVNGFDLTDAEAWPILIEYSARCLPPWSERELRHKLAEARKVAHRLPDGYLLGGVRCDLPSRQEPERPPRILGRITLPETALASAEAEASGANVDDVEARRIALELVKLHRAGAIAGPDDPRARFYAHVIHSFGATYKPEGQ